MKTKLTKSDWSDVVAKAWREPDFKAKLLADPRGALAEKGFSLPTGVAINVIENSTDKVNLVLPLAPDDLERFAANADLDFTDCTKVIPIC